MRLACPSEYIRVYAHQTQLVDSFLRSESHRSSEMRLFFETPLRNSFLGYSSKLPRNLRYKNFNLGRIINLEHPHFACFPRRTYLLRTFLERAMKQPPAAIKCKRATSRGAEGTSCQPGGTEIVVRFRLLEKNRSTFRLLRRLMFPI